MVGIRNFPCVCGRRKDRVGELYLSSRVLYHDALLFDLFMSMIESNQIVKKNYSFFLLVV